jgi:hypothetical protein
MAAALQGVTQISRLIKYPEDSAEDVPERWVAHLAHPVELELLSRGDVPESKYPAMMMQVNNSKTSNGVMHCTGLAVWHVYILIL